MHVMVRQNLPREVEILLKDGRVNVFAKNEFGQTAYEMAVKLNFPDIARMLKSISYNNNNINLLYFFNLYYFVGYEESHKE